MTKESQKDHVPQNLPVHLYWQLHISSGLHPEDRGTAILHVLHLQSDIHVPVHAERNQVPIILSGTYPKTHPIA